MKTFLALFFLGLLQGLTEFLPVSSSGHLVLFSKIFGIEESLFISIILHLATLCSILVVFKREVWHIITHPLSKESIALVVATIPTCVIALILLPIVKTSFGGNFLPICFALSAVLLFLTEILSKDKNTKKFNLKSAIFMGIAQGLAVFPGISRSGATISAGLLNGNNKAEVAKFSFIMSIPIIILSLLMEIYDLCTGSINLNIEIIPLVFSFIIAFLVGIFAIKIMVKFTEKANFKWFSIYLLIMSIISLFLI